MGSAIRLGVLVCVGLAAAIAGSGSARADEQKRITLDLSSLSDQAVVERLSYLEQRLDEERTGAQYWQYGWTAFNGGAMIATAVLAGTENNRKDRATDIVQSVEALIGVADNLLRPLPARLGADPVRAMPGETPEERRARLAAAEDLVARGADRSNEPYEVLPHLGVFGVNLVAGIAIWQFADARHAWQSAIPSVIIGELQLWTLPSRPADDLDGYRTQFAPGHAINWQVSPRPNGFQVSVRF